MNSEGILCLQESGACLSRSDCYYMVVFQYGSIVLFNVPEHEVDGYLKIVERHASGLLPEMRKDGELSYMEFLSEFGFFLEYQHSFFSLLLI